jgi:hypothetical protein
MKMKCKLHLTPLHVNCHSIQGPAVKKQETLVVNANFIQQLFIVTYSVQEPAVNNSENIS